jgi:hypothetical protein
MTWHSLLNMSSAVIRAQRLTSAHLAEISCKSYLIGQLRTFLGATQSPMKGRVSLLALCKWPSNRATVSTVFHKITILKTSHSPMLLKTVIQPVIQVNAKMVKSGCFSLYCLHLILILWASHVESSADVSQWCVDDVTNYNSYESALVYINSSSIQHSHLQTIIDDAFARAGCYWLEMTSSTNMTCSGVSRLTHFYTC